MTHEANQKIMEGMKPPHPPIESAKQGNGGVIRATERMTDGDVFVVPHVHPDCLKRRAHGRTRGAPLAATTRWILPGWKYALWQY